MAEECDVDVVGSCDENSSEYNFEQRGNALETFQDVTAKCSRSWTEEEKHLFFQGMELFGRKWSKISHFIGTRTTMQVKNFAYHLWKKEKRNNFINRSIKNDSFSLSHCAGPNSDVNLTSQVDHSETILQSLLEDRKELNQVIEMKDICILDHDHSVIKEESLSCSTIKDETNKDDSDQEIDVDDDLIPLDINNRPSAPSDNLLCSSVCDSNGSLHLKEHDESLHETLSDKLMNAINVSSSLCTEDSTQKAYPCNKANNEFEMQEAILENTITKEEKEIHFEFFEGSSQKTPERYLKIRNHILNCWEKCKPEYLSKTACRNGLKSCGDVNCIGRIHSYLEQIGSINIGCGKMKSRVKLQKPPLAADSHTCRITRMDSMRPRKRRTAVILEEVAMKQGGYTMEHDSNGTVVKETVILSHPTPKRSRVNPYKLIPCKKFSNVNHAPFKVEMTIDCLLIMDIHAHCLCTEVIGLLGGWYRRETKELQIRVAEPCDSLSTKIQCEMDPVSQTVASDALCSEGYQVVGWYHCHPTFAPLPSVQDLETQTKYQNLFKFQTEQPFVAIIISPYCQVSALRSSNISSTFNCIAFVDKDKGDYHDLNSVPFSFHVSLTKEGEGLSDATWRRISYLNSKIKKHPDEFNLLEKCRDYHEISYLEKLLLSLTHHMKEAGISLQVVENTIGNIRQIMLSSEAVS